MPTATDEEALRAWGVTSPRYDSIGQNYGKIRQTEPTWLAEIEDALGDAQTVLNVGAGTGSYESLTGRSVIALEPSPVMLAQRPPGSAAAVRGVAEALPFADGAFDAAMGVLTMHHWTDQVGGLFELARVSARQVHTVYDPEVSSSFWLLDYFPETRLSPLEIYAPTPESIAQTLRVLDVRTLWVPRDCIEGFSAASWARPHEYLDPERQQAVSLLALADPEVRARGTAQLADDLDSGAWHERYGHLTELNRADFGYRLVITEPG